MTRGHCAVHLHPNHVNFRIFTLGGCIYGFQISKMITTFRTMIRMSEGAEKIIE